MDVESVEPSPPPERVSAPQQRSESLPPPSAPPPEPAPLPEDSARYVDLFA